MDGFYYRDGLVGRYQSYNVLIDEEDYNEERDDIIQAIRYKGGTSMKLILNKKMKLILNKKWIGDMDNQGDIIYYTIHKPYKKKSKSESKPQVRESEFAVYSKEVNKFFDDLEDWWKDLNNIK